MPDEKSLKAWADLRRGNADALAVLYSEHYVGLMNYGMKLTSDRELTRDCITQVLLNLHRQYKRLPEVTNIRSYLLTSLRNEMLGVLRSGKKVVFYDPATITEINSEAAFEEILVARQTEKEHREKLKNAFEKLTEREKELLKLRFFEDQDYDAIAQECGITKRTAYNIINVALKRLKLVLLQHSRNRLIYFYFLYLLVKSAFNNF